MFSKTDGPTALRAELVRALSFAQATIERSGPGGKVSSVAALAAVWNGRKGYVALLVRDVEPVSLDRYVTDGAITSESALDDAVQEGLAFAESLGFAMDAHEFKGLAPDAREARMYRWNKLRKLRKPAAPAPTEAPLELPDLPPVPAGYEIAPDELSVPASAEPPPPPPAPVVAAAPTPAPAPAPAELSVPAPAAPVVLDLEESLRSPIPLASASPAEESSGQVSGPASSTVLGRISLVRRGGRLDLIARLLAFY